MTKLPKSFKPRRVLFYPVLPYTPRVKSKRGATDLTITANSPYSYNRLLFARSTNLITRVTSIYLNDSSTWSFGNVSKSGVKVPDWRQLIAKGSSATSGYARVVARILPLTYKASSLKPYDTYSEGYGALHGNYQVQQNDTTAIDSAALGRLKNKLNGYIGNAQLQAPIAESREIHRIVRQINTLGIDVVKSALAFRKTKGKSAAKFFGDAWLGFGFGINPMLKDIEKAANSILDYTTREDRHVRIVGTASQEYRTGARDSAGTIVVSGGSVFIDTTTVHVQGIRYVAGVDLKLRSAASYGVVDHLGLSITDLPSTLWELVPYSWMVDYFATVSPWLEDMFFTLPGVTKYISKNTKYQMESVWTARFAGTSAGYTCSGNYGPGKHQYVSFTRTSLTSLPTRPIRIKTLDEIAKNSLTKVLNLSAVLAGRHGGPQLRNVTNPRKRLARSAR